MATISTNYATLLDHVKRMDPDGSVASVAELLSITDEIIQDIPWKEGNLPTGEQVTMRTGLPTVAWRLLNAGVASSKSTTAQVTETCGMLEALSQIDKDVAMLNGNTAEFRVSESLPFLEAMNQEFADVLFYGDTSLTPTKFLGLAPRFSTISGANNGRNIIDCKGTTGDNTSMWLIGWSEQGIYGIFPKGSKGGLQHTKSDKEEWLFDSNQQRFLGFIDHFQWKCGIAVKDWRYVVRLANLDYATLLSGVGAPDIVVFMTEALFKLPKNATAKKVFYANRLVHSNLVKQALAKSNAALSVQAAVSQYGVPMQELSYLGIPIRLCDSILNTEDRIT